MLKSFNSAIQNDTNPVRDGVRELTLKFQLHRYFFKNTKDFEKTIKTS